MLFRLESLKSEDFRGYAAVQCVKMSRGDVCAMASFLLASSGLKLERNDVPD